MRRMEFKKCVDCGRMYIWEHGGIVMNPGDFSDFNRCKICRMKFKLRTIGEVLRDKKKH